MPKALQKDSLKVKTGNKSTKNRRGVVFLLPYPLHRAPSQRFRVENLLFLLEEAGIPYALHPFMRAATWQVLYKNGSVLQKGWGVVKGFLQRWHTLLFDTAGYDYVFIHREAAPVGPPLFEWLLAKVLRKKIIYDFDDAIWIPNTSAGNRLAASLKAFWKVKFICRWAHRIAAGNEFLAAFARSYNANVVVMPTCVDTVRRYLPQQSTSSTQVSNKKIAAILPEKRRPVIGWTGSHSTLRYLMILLPVLQALEKEHDFEFVVICDQPPPAGFNLQNLRFVVWQEATEIQDLQQLDIGVMPLDQDAWSEGKCGFKLIQYMALGIPAVASPVGVNKAIITNGSNGFLCHGTEEWHTALSCLLGDVHLRTSMGRQGRQLIEEKYSIQANASVFLNLIEG